MPRLRSQPTESNEQPIPEAAKSRRLSRHEKLTKRTAALHDRRLIQEIEDAEASDDKTIRA
jgi:hypothetical protein